MRFQALSLTTPSANVAGAAPATPPDFCFPCNVKYDYTPSGGGTIIDPITPPAPTGSTLTVGTGQTYATIAAALAAANNGDRLLLTAETFTLSAAVTVNKQITIQGASRAGTIIQSAGTGTDPTTLLTVQTSNFVIRDCTVKHRKTVNTSVETAVSVIGYSNTSPLATATGGSTTTMAVSGTAIAAGSNGQSLPQASINVASTSLFAASGSIVVSTSAGQQIVTYTGKTANSFTGCSGGTGTMSTGGTVQTTTGPWLTNQWIGAKVTFTTGANAGLSRIVSSNTVNLLTFPAFPNPVASGDTYAVIPMNVYFENVAVENVEFAIVLRCDNWQINNCHLAYVGPNNSTRRLIGVYRSDGQGLFTNSTYNSGQNGVITGNTRVFNVLSTVGLPIETLGGYLRLGYITSSNAFPVQQFFNCESFLAGATPLTFCVDNCNTKANGSSGETSAFVVFYTPSSQPTLTRCAQINLQSNTLSNAHGKGAIALDGPGPLASPGTTTFYAGGNSFTATAFTAGWASGVTGSSDPAALAQLGYATAIWANPNQSLTVPAGLNGLFTVDGVALQDGYRVFVVDSSNAVTSGIYSANAGAWYRSQDMVAGDDAAGDRFSVTQGTTYAGTSWVCTSSPAIVGTNALTFAAA